LSVARPPDPPLNHLSKVYLRKGFAHVIVHTGSQTTFAMVIDGMRRQCHDRRIPSCTQLTFTDGLGRGETVHFRHLAIHQHQIESTGFRLHHSFATMLDGHNLATQLLQHTDRNLPIDWIVLRQQNSRAYDPRIRELSGNTR
jgi:hypothetical protein